MKKLAVILFYDKVAMIMHKRKACFKSYPKLIFNLILIHCVLKNGEVAFNASDLLKSICSRFFQSFLYNLYVTF